MLDVFFCRASEKKSAIVHCRFDTLQKYHTVIIFNPKVFWTNWWFPLRCGSSKGEQDKTTRLNEPKCKDTVSLICDAESKLEHATRKAKHNVANTFAVLD